MTQQQTASKGPIFNIYLDDKTTAYTAIDRIGTGGNAEIIEAHHEDDTLAIKVSRGFGPPAEAAESHKMITKEGNILRSIQHHNIVPFRGSGSMRGNNYPCFAMPKLKSSLRDKVGHIPIATAIDYMIAIGEAAVCIHQDYELFYRDFKVDNMCFDDHGNPVLIDFGGAIAIDRRVSEYDAKTKTIDGSPSCMAPEYMLFKHAEWHRELSVKADQYSFGCALWELITGDLPYGYRHDDAKLHPAYWFEPEKLEAKVLTLPQKLRTVLVKVVNTIHKRYDSMEEVVYALADAGEEVKKMEETVAHAGGTIQ